MCRLFSHSLVSLAVFFFSNLAATLLLQSFSLCVFNFFGLAVIESCQAARRGSAGVRLELDLMESTEAAASLSLQNNPALLLHHRQPRFVPLDDFSIIAMYSFI